jgi:hypothetical protein
MELVIFWLEIAYFGVLLHIAAEWDRCYWRTETQGPFKPNYDDTFFPLTYPQLAPCLIV